MSRPSFPSRDSGIVDIGPYLGRPPEPLLQVTPAKEPRSRLRDAGMFLGGLSMLLLSAALLVFAVRTSQPPQPIVDANARLPEKVAKAAPAADEPPPPLPRQEAPAEEVVPALEIEEPPARPRSSASPRTPVRPVVRAEEPAHAEPDPTPRTLDALMDRAVAPTLPETPSRDEVARVLRGLSDEVGQCREQGAAPMTVTTRITIDGATGRVARAVVDGDAQWSTAGACIVRALSTARFSPFERDRFEVQFPYRL